ncbi:MAG: RNA 2',3'-cyclic phosphodiesterase [Candidatus Nanoarchaeia archaeon]
MRAFIAIALPEGIKAKITELIKEIKNDALEAKFVKPEQAHITVKFLGDVPESQINEIKNSLMRFLSTKDCFELNLVGMGHFNKKVLWIGSENENIFSNFAKELDEELSKIGISKERKPFRLHLTLARIKKIKNPTKFYEILTKYKKENFGKIFVSELVLIKSDLKRDGPIYTELAKFHLKCT